MKILKTITLLSISASLLISAPLSEKKSELKDIKQIGQNSSMLLLKTLGKNMKKNMKSGGVINALDFCSNRAYTLTEDVNKQLPHGVSAQRISAKYRSEANKPTDSELVVLKSFEAMKKNNIILPKQLIQKVDSHTYKYYKPLVITKQVCLKCHGTLKAGKLKDEISKRYPLDKAMGYKMGDLRGAVVVTIDKSVK